MTLGYETFNLKISLLNSGQQGSKESQLTTAEYRAASAPKKAATPLFRGNVLLVAQLKAASPLTSATRYRLGATLQLARPKPTLVLSPSFSAVSGSHKDSAAAWLVV
jgi:hypothetical protein